MSWFFIGILTLALGLAISEFLVRVSPGRLLSVLKWVGILIAVIAMMLFAIGVRNISLAALIGMALALLARSGMFAPKKPFSQGNLSQSSAHKSSEVETAYLSMSLDHNSGKLDGRILAGAFTGKNLSDLTMEELLAFRQECAAQDAETVPLVEAFLDREFGDRWREAMSRGRQANSGPMTEEEALNILGLASGATAEEVRAAHRRLMKKLHPDQGGSDFLARQINEAKDLLLNR